jgi:uncharacterized protein
MLAGIASPGVVDEPIRLPGVSLDLRWEPPPVRWLLSGGALSAQAGAATDLFVDPAGGPAALNAPRLLGTLPAGDFQLAARVTVEMAATFDAGVLLLWGNERSWAKLCLERSPSGEALVVSVVTRGVSDDANAFAVPGGPRAWLRVARVDGAFAFHASADGAGWRFVRHFALEPAVAVGLLAQSPMGPGCTAVFDEARLTSERLDDLRDGS